LDPLLVVVVSRAQQFAVIRFDPNQ